MPPCLVVSKEGASIVTSLYGIGNGAPWVHMGRITFMRAAHDQNSKNQVQSLKMAAANYFWSVKATAEDREEKLEAAHLKVQLLEDQLLSPGRPLPYNPT